MSELSNERALSILEERIVFGKKEYSGVAADYIAALQIAAAALRDRIDGKLISFADKPIIPSDQAGRQYIEDGDIRLIVQDGVYQGWYRPRGEEYHAKE